MRPARLNEVCEYKPIYDPSKYRATIRPFLSEIGPPDVVGIMLEYVHDDVGAARMSKDISQRIGSLRAPQWMESIQLAIGARIVRLGFRLYEGTYVLPRSTHRVRIGLRLAEDEWGNLYAFYPVPDKDNCPVTEKHLAGGFKEALNTPAKNPIHLAHLFTQARGSYIDKWGTLWIDGAC
jgi:hypothetical protein